MNSLSTAQSSPVLRPTRRRTFVSPLRPWHDAVKRTIDCSCALILLSVLSPVLFLVTFLIALGSPGSPVYKQWRLGRGRKPFQIYKFRTMRNNAHQDRVSLYSQSDVDGIIFKLKADPRITPLGRLLRKYSIDEFPQLFNVLRGEMSLVGPRPFPLEDFERPMPSQRLYQDWMTERHQVMPGMSGLWQVSGRNNLPFDKLVRLDLLYARYRTLRLDLWILWRTIMVILTHDGAY
jgi:lipopolysaccharide/colanic/teichoic acid biosynthesis glycosyltransferase